MVMKYAATKNPVIANRHGALGKANGFPRDAEGKRRHQQRREHEPRRIERQRRQIRHRHRAEGEAARDERGEQQHGEMGEKAGIGRRGHRAWVRYYERRYAQAIGSSR